MPGHHLQQGQRLGHPLGAAVELSGSAKQILGDGELFDDALVVALEHRQQRRPSGTSDGPATSSVQLKAMAIHLALVSSRQQGPTR